MRRVTLSVTNDLVSDARVHKVAKSLCEKGLQVTLVGRKRKTSLNLKPRAYSTKRMRLFFDKGFLFYAEFNFRLFFYLLFHPSDIVVANDLDTLLPNYIISKLRASTLYYDTHELFTEVPELTDRKMVKAFWNSLEQFLFPKLKNVYTVNQSLSTIYQNKYHVKVGVVRNVPLLSKSHLKEKTMDTVAIILYQGAVNKDRGLEEAIEAMQYIPDAQLIITGTGDKLEALKKMAIHLYGSDKVIFTGQIPHDELKRHTEKATLGLCIEKDTNLNYKYCLPNKLFDYMHAGVPVLASPLVEIKNIVDTYQIGAFIENHNPHHIAARINEILGNRSQLAEWAENTFEAAQHLNWQLEEKVLFEVYGLGEAPKI
jgi:glycosyltransferase involved in cell wall biosynthesis